MSLFFYSKYMWHYITCIHAYTVRARVNRGDYNNRHAIAGAIECRMSAEYVQKQGVGRVYSY
jgi:hypothetical protein